MIRRRSALRFWLRHALPTTWASYRLFCRAAPARSRLAHAAAAIRITLAARKAA